MFRYTDNIYDIRSNSSNNEHIIYCLKNGSVFLDGKKIYENALEKVFGLILKNNFYTYGSAKDYSLANFASQIVRKNPKGAALNTISALGVVISKNAILDDISNTFKYDFYYLLFDSNEETILFKNKSGVFVLNCTDTKSVFQSFNKLSLYDLLTAKCYWELNLDGRKHINALKEEKDVTIIKVIGIEDNQLIVFMSNSELISIDIETGNILWETNDFIKNNLPYYSNYRMVSSIFYYGVLENGKFYQLQGNNYFSIDLQTQQVDILWEDKSETNYLTVQYTSYTEDYIYFTGSRNNRLSPYLLGAFNRKTLQVDWVHEPEGIVNPLTNAPQYVNGKLYILDSGGILHIYEKE